MSETVLHTLTLTQQELSLVFLGLGELPTKHTYSLVKKLEAISQQPVEAPASDAAT